jgi:hypothetical protein
MVGGANRGFVPQCACKYLSVEWASALRGFGWCGNLQQAIHLLGLPQGPARLLFPTSCTVTSLWARLPVFLGAPACLELLY